MISEKHGLGAEYMEASAAVKQEVIEMAKQMSCYFTQIYEVKVTFTLYRICPSMYLICSARHLRLMLLVLLPSQPKDPAARCTHLGVGHSGITLIHQEETGATLVPVDTLR